MRHRVSHSDSDGQHSTAPYPSQSTAGSHVIKIPFAQPQKTYVSSRDLWICKEKKKKALNHHGGSQPFDRQHFPCPVLRRLRRRRVEVFPPHTCPELLTTNASRTQFPLACNSSTRTPALRPIAHDEQFHAASDILDNFP